MNVPALIWSITAAIGLLLSLYLAGQAILDLRSLGRLSNGRRRRVWARLASETIRLFIHGSFLVIGIAALSRPTGPLSWTVLVLLAGNVGLIANSLIAVYVQRLEPSAASVAEAAARDLLATAEVAARQILSVAARAAEDIKRVELSESLERNADAAERTAANTEKIARNTDPDGS